jgi:hypothetical protein
MKYPDSYLIRNAILFSLRKTYGQNEGEQVNAIYDAITEQYILDKLIDFDNLRKSVNELITDSEKIALLERLIRIVASFNAPLLKECIQNGFNGAELAWLENFKFLGDRLI